jgi:DNA ligase-4
VAWNVNGSFIISKGENIDVKSMSPTGGLVPCFVAFDILLLNDEVLSNLPYKVLYFFFLIVVKKITL